MLKTFMIATACFVLGSAQALADQPGKDWISKDAVIAKLKQQGYSDVRKLEADDGHWEGDATKNGVVYEIHVDPRTGELTKNQPK